MAVLLRRLGVKELCMVVVEAAATNEEATETARIRMKMASGDQCRRRR